MINDEVKNELNVGLTKLIKSVFTLTNWIGISLLIAGAYLYHKGQSGEAMPCFAIGGGFLGVNNKIGGGKA